MHRIIADPDGIRVFRSKEDVDAARAIEVRAASFRGSRREKAEAMAAALQAALDEYTPLADLPADDPDKRVDPGRPDIFHGTHPVTGERVLVMRSITVEEITWDAARERWSPTLAQTGER